VLISDAVPAADADPALVPGLLVRCDAFASQRPSVAPSAWSFVGWLGGLRPRRWRAGGLPRSRNSRPHRVSRGSPAWTLCGTRRAAVAVLLHKAMPGTPMGRAFVSSCCGLGCRIRCGHGLGKGCGLGSGYRHRSQPSEIGKKLLAVWVLPRSSTLI